MGWNEFSTCMGGQADMLAELASDGGQWLSDTIEYAYSAYTSLPEWTQAAIAAAASYGGEALAAAAAPFGLEIAGGIAVFLAGVGVGAGLGMLYNCREQLLVAEATE